LGVTLLMLPIDALAAAAYDPTRYTILDSVVIGATSAGDQ
jgi:hypothetical protein